MEYTTTLSVRLTEAEMKRLKTIMTMTQVKSFNEFFREALKKEYLRLFFSKNQIEKEK